MFTYKLSWWFEKITNFFRIIMRKLCAKLNEECKKLKMYLGLEMRGIKKWIIRQKFKKDS